MNPQPKPVTQMSLTELEKHCEELKTMLYDLRDHYLDLKEGEPRRQCGNTLAQGEQLFQAVVGELARRKSAAIHQKAQQIALDQHAQPPTLHMLTRGSSRVKAEDPSSAEEQTR